MAQVFCIFAASFQYSKTISIGRSALYRPSKILGDNDRPYTERCITGVRHGRVYKPILGRDALRSARGIKESPANSAVETGYRVISRDSRYLNDFTTRYWTSTCLLLDATLSNLVSSCNSLGYAVTAAQLHVVDERDTVSQIADSLPVLILPVADNALYARYMFPSSSGSACILRLEGAYETLDHEDSSMLGVDRHTMESTMQTWLGIRSGRWRHGWLEDAETGVKWYSDMMSSRKDGEYGFLSRRFDGWSGQEANCTARPSTCVHPAFDYWWGGCNPND